MNKVKSACICCCETPKEAWLLFKIICGALATFLLGCVIYAAVGLYERISEWNRIRRLKD